MRKFQEAVVSLVRSVYPGCLVSRRNWLPSRQCVATGWVLHASLCPGQAKVLLLRLLRCTGKVSINTSSLASKHRRRGQSGLAVSPYIPHSRQVTSPPRIPSSLGCFLRKWPGFLFVMLVYLHFKNLGLDLFCDFVQQSEVIKIRAQTLSESLATLLKIPHIRSDLVDGDSVTSFAKASCFSLPVCLTRCYPEFLAHCDETVLNLLSLKSFPANICFRW